MSIVLWVCLYFLSNSEFSVSQPQEEATTLSALSRELSIPGWDFERVSDHCTWPGITCSGGSNGSAVTRLDLSRRDLRGNLTLVSQLSALKWLDLSFNSFRGSIPSALGNLSELEFLDLSLNKFDGPIPAELGGLGRLRSLNLSNNFLVGEIPNELEGLKRLHELHISGNKLNGTIPLWLGNLTGLRLFSAYENALDGEIPGNLGLNSELELLNLHSNRLEGVIPRSLFASGKLEILILTQNRLGGEIPEEIGNCSGLSSVRIGNNALVGTVPRTIGNITGLTYFEADGNNLSGEVVPEFARCSNLTLLNLASNGFTGLIPGELGGLVNLQELILSGNGLFGDIPELKNLNKLDLTNNRINGTVPANLCKSSRLQYLLLSQNSIHGEIPSRIGGCGKLLELQMGGNYLTGTIPPEIGQIKNLQIALNLSFNHLRGSLPDELGKLDKLVTLDVSNNRLSGPIPAALKGMLSLIEVDFSNNLLTGPIPIFVPFQKSPNSSFSGNKALCGDPTRSLCPESSLGPAHHKASYKIVLLVIGSGLTVFISVTIIVVLFMMREREEQRKLEAKNSSSAAEEEAAAEAAGAPPVIVAGSVFVENLRQAIDLEAVVKSATKESNKVINGTFSVVYKAVMPSGLILAVKRLKSVDRTIIHHQHKMIRELERLSRLRHDNLERPIGFVIYDDVALLLHRHEPNGTLAQLLHGANEPDWPRRLSIAVGVAEGLAFLHQVAIIHLDISSVNVLLDGNYMPLVSEIEISKLLDPSRGTASISAVAGSFGYIPPEYAYTMQVTAPGNVYSYGVVLLEILTTRLPVEDAFGEGVDLVKWVHSAPMRSETPEQILDAKLSTVSFGWRKEMLAALKVALLCTDTTSAKRPKMKQVVEMLQEIKQS